MDRAFALTLALAFWAGAALGVGGGDDALTEAEAPAAPVAAGVGATSPPAGLAAGVGATSPPAGLAVADLAALAALALLALAAPRLAHRPALPLIAATFTAGLLAGRHEARWIDALPPPPPTPLTGEVRAVRLTGDALVVTVAPDATPAHAFALRLEARPPGLAPGARVRFTGRLRRLDPADEPGGYDARAAGRAEGVAWRARGALDLVDPAPPAAEAPTNTREAARAALDRSHRPYGAAVLQGLLLGDRAAVPESAAEALRATGTGHLLAVSGLHVGGFAAIVGGLALALASRLGAARPARVAAAVAAPAALAFVALAQFPLSACRAGLMVALYVIGRALGRRPDAVVLLAAAAVAILAARPAAAASAGFQLSFGAVGALLAFSGERGLRGAAVTALVAAGATAPIEAWHFGTVAPLAPLANLLLCPLAALGLVPLGLAGIALAPLTTAPLDLAAAGAEALVALAEAIAALGGGGLIVGRHAAPLAALPLVALVGLLTARPRAAAAVAAALAAAALALHPFGPRVDFLAVGQGDAVLIRSQGRAILVDAGPEDSGFRLLGSLRRAGVARLDAAYITHGHPDHFAGLAAVAAALPVAEVLTNGRDHDAPRWRRLRAALARHRVPLRAATPGPRPLGALTLTVLGGGGPPALGENDASITIRVDGPAASALLTGDIEARGEARLVAARPGRVTVLKAPHHGSLTSSGPALLDATCPAAAVVPVGRHNPHGLPHPAVVARYRARGIDLWRTDHDGRVTLRLDDPPSLTAHRRPTRALTDRPCPEPRP